MTPRLPEPTPDPVTGCWPWPGSLSGGYGKVHRDGKLQWAHRYYYEKHIGPIPAGMQIHHTCKNRACVNPEHLELQDPQAHGRMSPSKVSAKQVTQIRKRLANGEKPVDLAREYGLTRQTIGDIKFGRSWQLPVTCPNCNHRFDPYTRATD